MMSNTNNKQKSLFNFRKKDFYILNVAALLICLIVFLGAVYYSSQIHIRNQPVQPVSEKVLNSYQQQENKKALKNLISVCNNRLLIIKNALQINIYLSILLIMIFIGNIIIIIKIPLVTQPEKEKEDG